MMTNDLRERVARAIFLSRYEKEGGKWEAVAPEHKENPWRCMADAAIAEMGGVKVKPLEWWRSDTGDLVCDVSVGRYQIQKSGARYCMMPAMGLKRKNRPDGDAVPTYHKTKQNAVAAAQADYEDRILAAIEPAPYSMQEAARVLLDLLETRTKDAPISATAMEAVWQATLKEVGFSAVRGFLRALAKEQADD